MPERHKPRIHVGGVLGWAAMALALVWAWSIDSWPGWLQWSLACGAGALALAAVFVVDRRRLTNDQRVGCSRNASGQEAPTDPVARRYTLAELEALPVVAISQVDNLYIDDWPNRLRVWLSRAPPYIVTVERWTYKDGWTTTDRYRAR